MRPADVLEKVNELPGVEQARAVWQSRLIGSVIKAFVGIGGLFGLMQLLMRNNEPVLGIYVFGGLIGLLYGMVAIGIILIYKANRIINFAQAEIGAAAAVLAVLLIKLHHWPYLAAVGVCLVAGVASGAIVEFCVVRRFYKAPRLILSVATLGVALIFAAIQLVLPHALGAKKLIDPGPPKNPFSGLKAVVGGTTFDANALVIVFVAIIVMIGLTLFFKYTDIGLGVRASAENADRANLLGIPVKRVSAVVWILAGALSALGVFLRIPLVGLPIGVDVGPFVLLDSLAVAVIAKMENFGVALAAGVCIGMIEQTVYIFSRDTSVSYAIMLPILMVAMLTQRSKISRGQDSGVSTWQQGAEFRPTPPELRHLPEIAWGKFILGGLTLAALLVLPYAASLSQQILASVVLIYAMVAVSLVILTGWAGQISLGQWGFSGIGALVAGGLAAHMHADFFVTLVVAGVVGAVAAVIIGIPALRIQGLYLAVTTLAFGIFVQVYLLSPKYFRRLLPNRTQDIKRPILYGHYSLEGPRAYYFMTLLFLFLCLASARALRRSRAGRVMVAARDNEKGALSYGVSVARARLAAFAISGFWAAIAGALFAYHERAIDAAAFNPDRSLELLIIVVIGGLTSLPGAMLGAAWIGFLDYGPLRSQSTHLLASGFGVLVLLMFLPGGLAQVFYGARDGILRFVAERRKLVVPSLVADIKAEEQGLAPPTPEEETVLETAVETMEAVDA
jgi:branched-chain amino acid transport system permease protein